MRIESIKLPQSERFAASVTTLRSLFRNVEPPSIYLGALSKTFQFDSRCHKRPKLSGVIIASLGVSRQREGLLLFYPVSQKIYSKAAAVEFENSILPQIINWFEKQLSKPETAILGHEDLIIEWVNGEHKFHALRFL